MNHNTYIGKLICKLISLNVNEELKEELKSFNTTQWNQLYNFAEVYNLTPLLYSKMHRLNFIEIVPKIILNQLKNDYRFSSSISMKREHEIKQILKQFNDFNIDVILLKGLYISENYYDNPAERPMSDMDLLVKFSDLNKVSEILKMYGCSFESNLNPDECKDFIQHLPIIRTPKGFAIEVHWKLTADFNDLFLVKYNIEELWSSKKSIKLYGAECFVFKKEYLLIHLCVHISEDLFQQKILQLYDVFLIMKNQEINWKLLFEKAEEWNCMKAIYSVIYVVHKIFYLNIPQFAKDKVDEIFNDSCNDIQVELISIVFKDLKDLPKNKDNTEKLKNRSLFQKVKYALWTVFDKKRLIFWNGKPDFIVRLYAKRICWLIRKYTMIFITKRTRSKCKVNDYSSNMATNAIRKWFEG